MKPFTLKTEREYRKYLGTNLHVLCSNQKILADYTGSDHMRETKWKLGNISTYIIADHLESEEIVPAVFNGTITSMIPVLETKMN